ncbi:MAG: hypothetical protein C0620_03890 [Desulfuromonas sp.]|nr:MAG: hypothetical protein C0620_03890 [Desulfuromonas sp.]
MSGENSLQKQIVAGVISGLILLFISWILGFLSSLGTWLTSFFEWIISFLHRSITVPIWSVLSIVILIVVAKKLISNFFSRNAAKKQSSYTEKTKEVSPLEIEVVQLLACVDGAWLQKDDISRRLDKPCLLIEQALENLLESEFIIDSYNYIDGTSFRLSSHGRDAAINWGFIG